MNAEALAVAAGVPLATLNMWVTRGFVPGEKVGKGRSRNFDVDTAVHVAIVAELVRIGFAVNTAARVARQRGDHRRLFLAAGVSPTMRRELHKTSGQKKLADFNTALRQDPIVIGFDNDDLLEDVRTIDEAYPGVHATVDVEYLRREMRLVEEEWQRGLRLAAVEAASRHRRSGSSERSSGSRKRK